MPAFTYLQGDAVLGPSNVWAFGGSQTLAGGVFHWNGSRWRTYSLNSTFIAQFISASSAANVWIGWDTATTTKAAHWDGHRWHVIAAPDSIVANGFQIVPDGRGGYWFGPFADWTSHGWVSPLGISPSYSGGAFNALARIPGTRSFLMAAGVMNTGSSTEHPTIYRLSLG